MIFELFEDLLSEMDDEGLEELDDWDEEVGSKLLLLREAYAALTVIDRQAINYSELSTQAAYVFAYAIGRAEFTYQLLKRHREELGERIFDRPEVRITSLGGGPGSEIAGIVKYLLDPESDEQVESIQYRIFDKEEDWEPICRKLVEKLPDGMPIEMRFDHLDICDTALVQNVSLEQEDLVIMSFVISELCSLPEKVAVENNIRTLLKTIRHGGKLFYNDSNASTFYYFFNASKKYVKGLRQQSEVIDNIIIAHPQFGDTYERYREEYDVTPHLTSDSLSKVLIRSLL